MQTYLGVDEFCKLVHLEREVIEDMINRGVLKTKEENGEILIEASEGTMSVVPSVSQNLSLQPQSQDGFTFVEKTIGTILNLHEKVLDAKDELNLSRKYIIAYLEQLDLESDIMKQGNDRVFRG